MQAPSLPVRPLKRVEYEILATAGVFERERVELIHGAILRMSPIGPLHSSATRRLTYLLVRAIDRDRAFVRVQDAYAASDDSEPESDVAVVPPYDEAKEQPTQALLVVEVAESSLAHDRKTKGPLYAASNVPEYWIVNLVDRVIEVYAEPVGGEYQKARVARPGETLALLAFPDVTIAVNEVLP
jgi:Uma2 family endonuclease